MRVLHICTQKAWRGGENQIRLFIEGSFRYGIVNFVAVPQGGRSHHRFIELVETLGLPGSGSMNPLSIYRLIQFCRKNGIEIIDGQGSGGLSLALWVKKVLPHIKVVTHRRVDIPVAQNLFSRKKYLSADINRFVAISKQVKATMVKSGIPESKISVVPSAIETDLYKRLDRTWLKQKLAVENHFASDDIFLGSASALVETKGIRLLIEAFEKIRKSNSSVRLLLAGEGSDRAHLEEMVRTKGLQENVKFLGHITNVPEFLAAIDILAMPTFSEGLGTLLLDSTSAGTPVVASRVGGIPEVIIDNETGLLFEPQNVEQIVSAVLKLIAKPELRQKFVSAGQAHIAQNFSLKKMIEGNIEVYKQALA